MCKQEEKGNNMIDNTDPDMDEHYPNVIVFNVTYTKHTHLFLIKGMGATTTLTILFPLLTF